MEEGPGKDTVAKTFKAECDNKNQDLARVLF